MHFPALIAAFVLVATNLFASASDVTLPKSKDCITFAHLEAARSHLSLVSETFKFEFPGDFPKIGNVRNHPDMCAPQTLWEAASKAMWRVRKEQDLDGKLVDIQNHPAPMTAHAPALLFKRARQIGCEQQLKDSEAQAASTYSCSAAPHERECEKCTNWATGSFIFAIFGCLAKNNMETIPCCGLAATGYLTFYSQICLSK